MKTQLIIISSEQSIIVSDEEINHRDYVFNILTKDWFYRNIDYRLDNPENLYFKIIAGIPSLPLIDYSLLSEDDCKKIGFVDVGKIADKLFGNNSATDSYKGWIEGFKAAQSLNDKMFSLDDMERAYDEGYQTEGEVKFEQFIQSIQQPKVFDIEIEMELFGLCDCKCHEPGVMMRHVIQCCNPIKRPKITNKSIKITKIL